MNRLATALICGGALLLLIWQVSPATSAPPPPRNAVSSELDQAAPVLAEVTSQVDRLRERLATVPTFPPPSRDPFNFGRRPDPTPRPAPAAAPATTEPAPAPPLPSIVAILLTSVDGADVRTAAFAVDDDVQLVTAGQTIGQFIVRSISADHVVLVDRASGTAYSIKLD